MKIHTIKPMKLELMDIPRWFFGSIGLGIVAIAVAGQFISRTYKFWRIMR